MIRAIQMVLLFLFFVVPTHYARANTCISKLVYRDFSDEEFEIKPANIIKADFDGNNLIDYATVITNYHYENEELIVYLQLPNNKFNLLKLFEIDKYNNEISEITPGKSIEPDDKEKNPFKLQYSAIKFYSPNLSSTVFHWSDNKFKQTLIKAPKEEIFKSPNVDIDAELIDLIHKHYPNHMVVNPYKTGKMIKDNLGADTNVDTPSIIKSDFDGNGLQDYAVLLEEGILSVFRQTNKNTYDLNELINSNSNWAGDYILEVKPNTLIKQTEALLPSVDPVKLPYSSIELIYFEKSSVVYYWDNAQKDFMEIWTSD